MDEYLKKFLKGLTKPEQVVKRFCDVVSGRKSHWVKTNDVIMNEFWSKVKDLDSPYDTIFKSLLVAANIVVEELTNMGEKRKAFATIDCRKLDIDKFRQLYALMLTYFSFLLCYGNKQVKQNVVLQNGIKKTAGDITNTLDTVDRTFRELDVYYVKSQNGLQAEQVAGRILNKIVEIAKTASLKEDLQFCTYFMLLSSGVLVDILKDAKAELGN